jgi:hypothetical protein
MAMIVDGRGHGHAPATQSLTDQRLKLRRAAQLRLSGATVEEAAACNPVDLRIASFSRVTHFDFLDDGPVTARAGRRVDDDDLDW